MNFTKEQIEKAKKCQSIGEFKNLVKEEELNLSDTEVEGYFNAIRTNELQDDDLAMVTGGCGGGKKYPDPKFNINDIVKVKGADPYSKFPSTGRITARKYEDNCWRYMVTFLRRSSWCDENELERVD